jgi:hypothetical protein
MHLHRFFRRLNELVEIGCIELNEVDPCTPEEIATLERTRNLDLPPSLRELYLWGGKSFGDLFQGMELTDFNDHMKVDHRAQAQEILKEQGADPTPLNDAVMVQFDYDNNFGYVRPDELDDPPIYGRIEGEGQITCWCERLSDYLLLMLEQIAGINDIEFIKSAKHLTRLAELKAHLIQHALFAGEIQFPAIPNEVFALRELRSLNLVGKGIIDLSPRIQELTSLKQLVLARNSLSSLPMALAHVDELEELDLADNQLSSVIDVLGCMPALRFCVLTGNPISTEEIDQLRSQNPDAEILFEG